MLNCFNSSTIYISKEGDDRYTGYAPVFKEGNIGPIKSITKLKMMLNRLRIGQNYTPITVRFMGDFEMDSIIELGAVFANSMEGKEFETANITFESYGEKRARLIGGKKLKGFKQDNYNGVDCISLYIPEVKNKTWHFTDLFVNGRPAKLCRYPSEGTLKAVVTENNHKSGLADGSKWFIAHKEDLEGIEGVEDAIISYNHYWVDEHSPIESYDRESGKVVMSYPSRFLLRSNYDAAWKTANMHYYLENIGAAFSSPGEWFLDVKNGMLYYIPLENENVDDIEIIAPTVKHFIDIHGDDEHIVKGIRFRNLDFIATKGDYASVTNANNKTYPESCYASDAQAWCDAYGSIRFENAEDCRIENCNILCPGIHGVEINKGCNNIVVENCNIENCGGGGVKIWGTKAIETEDIRPTGNCAVKNSKINNCGHRYAAGCGVLVCHAAHNEISGCEISNLEYSGVSVGWVWGYQPSTCYGNIIKNNHIHHIGQGRLSDMGGIYLLGRQHGTVVSGNIVHDVTSAMYGGMGIYTDEGSSYITIENNIVYRCKEACYQHHFGKNNILRNNIFAYAGKGLIDISKRENLNAFIAEENILITDNEPVFSIGDGGCDVGGSVWSNNKFWNKNGEEPLMINNVIGGKIGFNDWMRIYSNNADNVIEKPSDDVLKMFEQ